MIRTRILRSSLAPVLFAAACTTPSSTDQSVQPAPRFEAAVPMADVHAAAAPRLFHGGSMPAMPAATAAESAIAHVHALAPQWGVRGALADISAIGTVKVGGGEIVRLRQRIDGVPVERGELRVMVGPGGNMIAASGVLAAAELPRDRTGFTAAGPSSVTDGRTAIARALAAVHGVDVPVTALASKPGASDPQDPATWAAGTFGDVHVDEARARKTWYRSGDALTAAWIVEAYSGPANSPDATLHRVVVAARGGRILEQRDLTVDASFSYRVWAETAEDRRPLDGPTADFVPHPTGAPGAGRPAYVPPSFVAVDGLNDNGAGGFDPWLPAGATTTSGNNVDAYSDTNSPSGFNGADFRASTTAPGVFDRVYDTTLGPLASQGQQMAAITQLFFSINWLHDEWYDAGFTEAAGNGQEDNYGRGGVGGDAVRAEAQDFSGRNNANMSTPDDGMNPRMQVFVWSGAPAQEIDLTGFAVDPVFQSASYGPPSYEVTAQVVAGTDGGGASATDGCEDLTGNVAGRIVVLDRGNCTFKAKTLNVQEAGGAGMILVNNVATGVPSMGNDTSITTPITIPSVGITQADGATLRQRIAAGAVNARLFRQAAVDNDGSLDGGLVAHEFGHYVHHRLSVCGTRMCGAMSEGWADFIAMHMMGRPGDNLDGTYALSGYAFAGDPYFGLRRAPYSVDRTKNAFTFEMVADDAALPSAHPLSGGGPNSEVHNAGEVWAQALWEVYIALQKRPGAEYEATRDLMARYIVAGLLLAPPDGTFTEIRDAVLAAAFAANPADHDLMAAAFATRGLGTCANSPERDSVDFIGAQEAFEVSGRATPGEPVVTFTRDCDADGSLDAGDIATVTLPIANAGAIALSGGATVAVASATPGLVVPSEAITIGAIGPYASETATFEIRASADVGAGPVAGTLDITVNAAGCVPSNTFALPLRVQTDYAAAASAIDTFDAVPSVWTTEGGDAELVWTHAVDNGLDRGWHGADAGAQVDVSLVSPAMTAGAGDVTVSFDHSHQFEFSDDTYWDGGVIEISTDGGLNWDDVSMYAVPGYNGVLGGDSGNPLDGRQAFGSTNPSYPGTDRVTLEFGTQLGGETFQLRFRIATDGAVGAPGWEIDNLSAAGISNTPFPTQGAETGSCEGGPGDPDGGTEPPGGEPGGCCSTGGGTRPSDLLAGLFAGLALLWRGRRRRAAKR